MTLEVTYLGNHPNKRQRRGNGTGRRYSFSSLHRVFNIDERDRADFENQGEDGKPMFLIWEPQPVSATTAAPTEKARCIATTKSGAPCKAYAQAGREHCNRHG